MSRTSSSSLSWLEKAVLVHAALLLLGASWIYGGNIWWMRVALSCWATLGAGLTVTAFFQAGSRGRDARRKAPWLIPLALFCGLVLLSAANPSFRAVHIDGGTSYIQTGAAHPGWPSTIAPGLSLRSVWLGAGVYLSAFNLAAVLQSRSALRGLLVLIASNTLALSVLGTVQKLAGSGFYFGAAHSPNIRFFATFIYYNHWGAFMILGLTTAAGLLFYHARRHEGRDLWHSPFSLALLGVLLIATSAPVSASRASTVIVALVMGIAVAHALVSVAARRRARRQSAWQPLALILVLVLLTTGAIGWLSYRSITERFTETRLAIDQDKSVFGGRAELYRDTWRLASRQPVFGWGLDTYAVGFQMIRPFTVNLRDNTENVYATAHCDWLQSLAETGFAGTGLIIGMILAPLLAMPRRFVFHPLAAYPLLGCALVVLYAGVEFPFANGAVLITFCLLFFTTLRHAQLTDLASRNRHE